MADISFITDETLRNMLERDFAELQECIKNKLYKSALIMAGSIIEASLVDYFLSFPPPNGKSVDQIKRADLADLIDWASDKNVGLISDTTKNIATVVRNYRNLIHPGVEYRKQFSIEKSKANVAQNLVEIIFDEIRENYLKKLGYTAEQAIRKIELDMNCFSLFDHMIASMSPIERVKLYKRIPLLEYEDQYGNNDEQKFNTFNLLHTKLKPFIPQEVRRAEVQKLYKCISERTKEEAILYLCFVTSDIDLLDQDKINAVLDYIFSILESTEGNLLEKMKTSGVFSGISKFYNNDMGVTNIINLIMRRRNCSRTERIQFLDAVCTLMDAFDYNKVSLKIIGVLSKYSETKEYASYIESNIIPF